MKSIDNGSRLRDLSDTGYVYFFGEGICHAVKQAHHLCLLVIFAVLHYGHKEHIEIEDGY
ncbi:MAG: hypothetical protein ACTS7E_04175 [Arsenophonus sp. NC-CH8-MAG3]